jgi:diaminopimelate epimerase
MNLVKCADGLLVYREDDGRASMRLLNADGSASEISGNGLRCLAAWLAGQGRASPIAVETDAGPRRLELLGREGSRYTFRASMGLPEAVRWAGR